MNSCAEQYLVSVYNFSITFGENVNFLFFILIALVISMPASTVYC